MRKGKRTSVLVFVMVAMLVFRISYNLLHAFGDPQPSQPCSQETKNHTTNLTLLLLQQELELVTRNSTARQQRLSAALKQKEQELELVKRNSALALTEKEQELAALTTTKSRLWEELFDSYSNYYLHTPKTGGYSFLSMVVEDRKELSVAFGKGKHGENQRICNHQIAPIQNAKKWPQCWLHTTESTFTTDFTRRFLVVRDPLHHVPSMYYHCTESPVHRRKELMPKTMDRWLELWTAWQEEGGQQPEGTKGGKQPDGGDLKKELQMNCYNPVNMQSRMAGLMDRYIDKDLTTLYDVVGLTSEMSKTTCLVSIAIHRKVPQRCNCTDPSRSAIKMDVQVSRWQDHGVTHHGHTTNLTDHTQSLIRNITVKDRRLYKAAQTAFWNKVATVEKDYSFKLC